MSINNEKVVLILEKQTPVHVVDEDNFILEGNAAVFGVENENHRVYEEDEYMPHLEYLQEKIARRKLVGEMDHPEKFETSLKGISHIIEKLWYDKPSRTLKCRIRVLDTDPHGLNARKLIKAGYPLSLSSRAAGVVQENKSVKIKRIFAYDLVADGGFGDKAELARVNESLGFDVEELNKTDLTTINEELGIENDNLSIYDVTESYKDYLNEDADFAALEDFNSFLEKNESTKQIYNKNNSQNMDNPVTTTEMNKYSLLIKEEMEKFSKEITNVKETLSKITESKDNTDETKVTKLEEQISKLQEQNNVLSEKLNNAIKYAELIGEQSNKSVAYSEKLSEHISMNRKYTEKVGSILNKSINYSENIGEKLNQQHNYVNDVIKEHLNNSINFSNELSKHLNGVINYSENIGEKFNYLASYAEKIGNTTNNVIKYASYLAENSVVKEDFENFVNYSEEMLENKSDDVKDDKVNENKEETKQGKLVNNYKSLGEKIDMVLEKIKTQKKTEKDESTKYPFMKNLNEKQLETFTSLNEAQKSKAATLILENNSDSITEDSFNSIVESATDKNNKWLTEMPEDLKASWEKLDESQKDSIRRKANWYNLESDYQIRNFWRNQKLEKVEETKVVDKVNESKKEESKLGYSSEYVKRIGEGLNRFS